MLKSIVFLVPLPFAVSLSPPPCSGSDVEIVPAKCATGSTGPGAGKAEGSYCAPSCGLDSDCPDVSGLKKACTMNQGKGSTYCEYKCSADSDCPTSGGKSVKCEKNIVSSICTYPFAPTPAPTPTPAPPPPAPTPAPPPPSPQNSHVRVVKAIGSRGYNKVRVSLIMHGSADGANIETNVSKVVPLNDMAPRRLSGSMGTSDVKWSYQNQFQQRWTGNSIKSAIVDVTPGVTESLRLDGLEIQIKVPKEDDGVLGMIFGDPCTHSWCKYQNTFKVDSTLQRVINGLSAHDALDYWMINGDILYDQSGVTNQEFIRGFSLAAQARLSAITLGNHDYWIGGSPAGDIKDSFGNGHMQFWAGDTLASKADESKPFDFGKKADSHEIIDIKNSFWYSKIGNVAIIGFSNAYSWSNSEPYFKEACSWAGNTKPKLILLVGHWNSENLGCQSGMDDGDVYKRVKNLNGCSGVTTKYVEGHKHCNQNVGDGALLGSNGYDDGDHSCHGAFGIPIIDTRNNNVKLWYFELWAHEQKSGSADAILNCLESQGLDSCLHYATTWWDQSLDVNATAARLVV